MDKCKKDGRPCIFSKDCFEPEEEKVQTNADRIRTMSDQELEELLNSVYSLGWHNGATDTWDDDPDYEFLLQQPAE